MATTKKTTTGRKRGGPEEFRICFWTTKDQAAGLQGVADQQMLSVAAILRRVVARYLDEYAERKAAHEASGSREPLAF